MEFDHVIIIDFNEGVFPKIVNNTEETEKQEIIEQFRNLAYVAITRAKMQLVIISSDKKSPFIREFDKNTYELIADGGKPKEPDVPPDYSLTVEVGDTIISKLISNGTKHKIWIWPELYSHHNSIIGLHIDDKFKLDFKEYRIIEIRKKGQQSSIEHKDSPKPPVPPKPPIQDAKTIIEFARQKGFRAVDNRQKDGALWVLGDISALLKFQREVKDKFGVPGNLGKGRASGYSQAWYTTTSK